MERYYLTDQSPQWAVVPMDEEEEVLIHIKAYCINSRTHIRTLIYTYSMRIYVMVTKSLYGHLTYHEDLYVYAICHVQCTMGHILHINIMTVLPHANFYFHSIPQHMVCKCAHTDENVL
jgi:hypothetical protein